MLNLFLNLRTYHDVVVNFSSYTAILQSRRNADRGGFSTSLKIEPESLNSMYARNQGTVLQYKTSYVIEYFFQIFI